MSKVSIIIPTRVETMKVGTGESILQRTVRDIYEKATGEFEVIVAFDGPPYESFTGYKNITTIRSHWVGTKPLFNLASKIATGKYLLKVDAHCMFAKGFDEELQTNMQETYIVMPRFYVLDAERWEWQDDRYYDYFALPYPFSDKRGVLFKAGGHWAERNKARSQYAIDENMKLHGSFYFMEKEFFRAIGGFETNGSGTWNGDDIELTMKAWLGHLGGKIVVNKNTWYAHMHRGGQRPREWTFSYREAIESARWTANYWMRDSWEHQQFSFEWLIDKFSPVQGWGEDWKTVYRNWLDNSEIVP